MKIREAIQIISKICFLVTNEEDEFKCRKCQKALKIAISAMKRHIPKKPIQRAYGCEQCPTCKAVYEEDKPNNYCGRCGQKFRNGETENAT